MNGWLKGIAASAAFAALVALPVSGHGAGKVASIDIAQGSGKVSFQDFHFARVSQRDFHFTMATGQHIKSAVFD